MDSALFDLIMIQLNQNKKDCSVCGGSGNRSWADFSIDDNKHYSLDDLKCPCQISIDTIIKLKPKIKQKQIIEIFKPTNKPDLFSRIKYSGIIDLPMIPISDKSWVFKRNPPCTICKMELGACNCKGELHLPKKD